MGVGTLGRGGSIDPPDFFLLVEIYNNLLDILYYNTIIALTKGIIKK